MATLVEVKPFRICPRWPLKNPKDGLTSFSIYKISKRKTIAIGPLKISEKMYNRG